MNTRGGATQTIQNSQYAVQASDGSHASLTINEYYLQGLAKPMPVAAEELAKARARFDEMPINSVPDPEPLPYGSHMPLLPNRLFVGRAPELLVLAKALKAGGTAAVGEATATTGLGGIGKTQLAAAFAYRYGTYFSGVFWLSFGNPEAVPAEIARCGGPRALDLHRGFDGLALPDQLGLVAAAFASDLPRLLVFDNCEDEDLLASWLPRAGAARVLITSRRTTWSASLGVRSVPLGVLPRTESVALLLKFRADLAPDDSDLDAISHELGDLPLALHMAGSYLRRYRYATTPASYLAELKEPGLLDHPSLTQAMEHSPTAHEQNVARTFALSLEKLSHADETDAIARALLNRAAFFAPGEPIPRDLLKASTKPHFLRGRRSPSDAGRSSLILRLRVALFGRQSKVNPHRAEDALKRLSDLGLIEEEKKGAIRLHRLLAAFVCARCKDPEGARMGVEQALAEVATRLNRAGLPAAVVALQPHLRSVAAAADAASSKFAGSLYGNLGYHLHAIADTAGASTAYQRARDIIEKALGTSHPLAATTINNLGGVFQDQGDLARAKEAFKRALSIDEHLFGPHHPNVARDVNNLATALRDEGDLAGAKVAFQRALAIFENVYGRNHPNVAATVNNLGLVMQDEGDLAGAKAAYQRALSIDERAYGSDHPNVATTVNNLGTVLRDEGDLAGAKAAYQRALSIRESAYAADHPDILMVRENLEIVTQKMQQKGSG